MTGPFDTIVLRKRRRVILEILEQQRGRPAADASSLHTMLETLCGKIPCKEFRDLIGYLSDDEKRMIRVKRSKIGQGSISMITLTSCGKDLLEGTVNDPGISSNAMDIDD